MNDNRISQYMQGRNAFAILTGEIDKDAQKAQLREGYKALQSLKADGVSIREVMSATGLSKGKVERDFRAAEYMALFPKVDPVTVVKACNVASATALRKATADAKTAAKGLAELVKESNKERREARPNDGANKTPKTPKGPKAPATVADMLKAYGALGRGLVKARETGKMTDAEHAQAIKDAEYILTMLKGAKVKAA